MLKKSEIEDIKHRIKNGNEVSRVAAVRVIGRLIDEIERLRNKLEMFKTLQPSEGADVPTMARIALGENNDGPLN